ncbi:MAG: membrane protein insertase YidC [Alphaproteobacteria bacterium 32-64-14]|nr:MAG: membrane protein insertase YidC [Alphaproteobacteria bacterium 32-64-14]
MEQNDQRNILLALVLCFGLFMIYNWLVLDPQQKAAQAARQQAQQNAVTQAAAPAPTIRQREEVITGQLTAGTRVALDAKAIEGSISLLGARIDDVQLKGFYETIEDKEAKRPAGEIKLMAPEGTERAFYATVAWTTANTTTDDVVWTPTSTGPLTTTNPLTLTYATAVVKIDRKIEVDADYLFTVTDVVTNTGAEPVTLTQKAELRQRQTPDLVTTPHAETGAHRGALGVYGSEKNQMVNYNDLNQGKAVARNVTGGWNALTTKYWMAATIPEQAEEVQMQAGNEKLNGQTTFTAGYSLMPYVIQPSQSITKISRVFAGAKRVDVLERYENDGKAPIPSFTDAVDWSFMFFITKPFFWLLKLLHGWLGAFGLAILALTIVVKTVFFPLQFNMYKSMSKMRLIQPELKGIQERFAADPQRLRQEQAKLMQREKVNPLAGCLPLIPTMFVFYALFHVLNVTIEMRHTPFVGWIRDMSAADPTSIFNLFGLIPWEPRSVPLIGGLLGIGFWPILYGATMFGLQSLSAPPGDKMQAAIMKWIPLLFTVLFAGFAAGLVIYYVWSNLISIIQQYIIMRRTGVETELDKWIKKRFGKKEAA